MNLEVQKPTVLILGDDLVGVEVANWLATKKQGQLTIKFATRGDRESKIDLAQGIEYLGALIRMDSNKLAKDYASPENFLITCYWPWILPISSYENYSGNTINFHPALLPNDRGWYPHVHQIRHNLKSGVTLHQLSENADTGDIWAQSEVKLPFPVTADQARKLLQNEMALLFKNTWEKIFRKSIIPQPQSGEGSYWEKSDTDILNKLELQELHTTEDFIRILSCRNFGNKSFISVNTPSGKKFVHIRFSDTGKLE